MISELAIVAMAAATAGSAVLPPTADHPYAPLTAYDGTWSVTAEHPFSGGKGPDTLENYRNEAAMIYSCQQVVNGKPVANVTFAAGNGPDRYEVTTVQPGGKPLTGTELTLSGEKDDHWTFLSKGENGKIVFRVENTIVDADHIRFEMFSTSDGGTTWASVNRGEDVSIR